MHFAVGKQPLNHNIHTSYVERHFVTVAQISVMLGHRLIQNRNLGPCAMINGSIIIDVTAESISYLYTKIRPSYCTFKTFCPFRLSFIV